MRASRLVSVVGVWAVMAVLARSVLAQTATQVVTFQVVAINQIAVSGDPQPLVASSAPAGGMPTSATVSGTSYGITTNEGNKKVVVSLDLGMPLGVGLAVTLAAPAGAASAGRVSLGVAGSDAVTGIPILSQTALPITYTLTAAAGAGIVQVETRTVSMTIVSGT